MFNSFNILINILENIQTILMEHYLFLSNESESYIYLLPLTDNPASTNLRQ